MLIAVPTEFKSYRSQLSKNFGRSNFFAFYNPDTGQKRIIKNPYQSIIGSSGIQSAQFMIENKVSGIITCSIGINAQKILSSADVKIFFLASGNFEAAIEYFKR